MVVLDQLQPPVFTGASIVGIILGVPPQLSVAVAVPGPGMDGLQPRGPPGGQNVNTGLTPSLMVTVFTQVDVQGAVPKVSVTV